MPFEITDINEGPKINITELNPELNAVLAKDSFSSIAVSAKLIVLFSLLGN